MVIKVYVSGMSGNKEVKKRQQRVTMIMDSKHIEYTIIDITEPGQEGEKDHMQTHAVHKGCTISDPNPRHALPPQLFHDTEYCGDYDDFDLANELDNLEVFLKLAAPESAVEHKNGAPAVEEAAEVVAATDAVAADDDEDKENKTEDNTADGGAADAAAEDGTNNENPPVATGEANEDGEAPVDTTVQAVDAVVDGTETGDNSGEPSAKQDDSHGTDGEESQLVAAIDNTEDNEEALDEPKVKNNLEGAATVEQVDRSSVEPTEAASTGVKADVSIPHEEQEHGDPEETTPPNDDVTQDVEPLAKDNESVNEEPEQPAVVAESTENNGDDDEEKKDSTDDGDESETTSEDEEDSQRADNVTLENDTDKPPVPIVDDNEDGERVLLQQRSTENADDVVTMESETPGEPQAQIVANNPGEESVPSKEGSTENADNIVTMESETQGEPQAQTVANNNRSTENAPNIATMESDTNEPEEQIDADNEDEESVLLQKGSAASEPASDNEETTDDQSEIKDKATPVARSVGESERNSVDTGTTEANSSTPASPATVEETPSAGDMDADDGGAGPDAEEEQLLQTSAALAGKSEDAEEIDIDEEEEAEEERAQPAHGDAEEDEISSKLVDADDPMMAQEEQEE